MGDAADMNSTRDTFSHLIDGLRSLGYNGALLELDYKFADWFSPAGEEWHVEAAAFGQTPNSYDSACIGVVCANGLRCKPLIDKCRALGAPIVLEVDGDQIREWSVCRKQDGHGLVDTYQVDSFHEMLAKRAAEWRPQYLLRLKSIGSYQWHQQLGLFSGLLPELEERIQSKLDPLLRETLSQVRQAYLSSTGREPNASQIFKLLFWTLTAKVFYDRQVRSFSRLSGDPDQLLAAVAAHYGEEVPRLLNREARQIAADRIWEEFDFRNLSVEVLAQIWASTLVDDETKRKLSIHRTSRSIVRYVVERIPFDHTGDDRRIILEPCSGSGVFLIGAMNALRQNLYGSSAIDRHRYFVQHLAGIEADPFAVEISKLALTLADFPNPNGWRIELGDVLSDQISPDLLQQAGVVLCNPPYSDFEPEDRLHYGTEFVQRPAAILCHTLQHIHPQGVLGFVMPRTFVDGRGGYSAAREQLARRFATIEITLLPDRAFDADSEIALVIAKDPIPHRTCRVINRKVNDNALAWSRFEEMHEVSGEYVADLSVEDAKKSLVVPELPEVWNFLISYPKLEEIAELHRGIEWNLPLTGKGGETGNRAMLVKSQPTESFRAGIAPQTVFSVFEIPPHAYLAFDPELQRTNAWKHDWEKPKAILNKAARSRGRWRIAAFPDSVGLTCYQTYIGVWSKLETYDEFLLAAVLNSPVANAFVATHEGKTDVTMETLMQIPVPVFTATQRNELRSLIHEYQEVASRFALVDLERVPENLLKRIDAVVLSGYRMPPRIERQLLDFFLDQERPISHSFSAYFPREMNVYFSLSDYLSQDFSSASVGELIRRRTETSPA